jgi:hypothetical protein
MNYELWIQLNISYQFWHVHHVITLLPYSNLGVAARYKHAIVSISFLVREQRAVFQKVCSSLAGGTLQKQSINNAASINHTRVRSSVG